MIWLVSSFFAYALASLAWAPSVDLLAVVNLLGLAGAFWLGLRVADTRLILLSVVFTGFVFAVIYIFFPLLNPNVAGCALAIVLAAALSLDLYVIAMLLSIALVWTQSRGAILAGVVAVAIYISRRHPWLAILAFLAGFGFIAELRGFVDTSSFQRLGIWQDTYNHLTLFGTGWGSFQSVYEAFPVKTNMTLLITSHAYNDYLELLSDLGVGAIPLILAVVFALSDSSGSKLILLTFLALGLTYFPLSIPVVAQIAAFSLGHLTRSTRYGSLAFSSRSLPQYKRH